MDPFDAVHPSIAGKRNRPIEFDDEEITLSEPVEEKWQGWSHWINQELAKCPGDEMLLLMKDMMKPVEPDLPTDEDLRSNGLRYSF